MTTFFSHVNFAGGTSGVVDNPFGRKLYVSNAAVNEHGVRPGFVTIASAISNAQAGDTITIGRGTYTENPNFNLAGLTVRAGYTGGYPDQVVITGTSTVNASNVTIEGIEFFSNSATAASLQVGSTTEVNSFVARRCSFASDGTTEPRYGLRIRGGNNHRVEFCRFVDNTYGFVVHSGLSSFASGVTAIGNEFLENTTLDFGNLGTGDPNSAAGAEYGIHNLLYVDNYHGRGQVTPTDFVNITDTNGTSSGFMARNTFASATNASATITIPAGILYGPNGTEAGWSTARPS